MIPSVAINTPIFEEIRRPPAILPSSSFIFASESVVAEAMAAHNIKLPSPDGANEKIKWKKKSDSLDSLSSEDSTRTESKSNLNSGEGMCWIVRSNIYLIPLSNDNILDYSCPIE